MKRLKWALVAAGAAFGIGSIAQAGILVSEKEILRASRVEWLSMKRHLPIEPDQRVQNYVQCIANRLIAELDERAQSDGLGSRRVR